MNAHTKMKRVFQPLLWFFTCITISYAAEILQNPDFEIPPTNITTNATSQFLLLNKENSIPGWSFNGTVWYVTSGGNFSLPGNGHGIQLGENGKINQTFKGTDEALHYILSLTLAVPDERCSTKNFTAVNISIVESETESDRSRALLLESNLSQNLWESYAIYLVLLGRKMDSINLEIKSVTTTNLEPNVSCWPVVDTFIVKRHGMPVWYSGNALANGDFEIGPAFLNNSSKGILLTDVEEAFESPLQQWKILGTIKYIDSQHFKVPQGKAAIQLISGPNTSGIQTDFFPRKGFAYTLNFTMGDAKDSCLGFFIVYVQIGNKLMNFTMQSNGTGSTFRHSITVTADETGPLLEGLFGGTHITFFTVNETTGSDGLLCGPVLDNIVLDVSYGEMIQLSYGVVIFSLFLILLL